MSEWIANFIQDDLLYYDDLYEDAYDDTMPGGDSDVAGDIDDGIFESLVIVGLAAALVFLLLYRQQRQAQARRDEENARQQQQQRQPVPAARNNNPHAAAPAQPAPEGDFFPPPEWAPGPGGVGH